MANRLKLSLEHAPISGAFLVTTAEVDEAISAPTRATVRILARADLSCDEQLGQPATLVVWLDEVPVRRFHLVLRGFCFDGLHRGDLRRYVVHLEHELCALTLRTDVRMFQDKNAQQIVHEVLQGAGIASDRVESSITRALANRAVCVQYRETDFDFVSRLCEHEGIFYLIAHDDDAARVRFADAQSAFCPVDGPSVYRLTDDDQHGEGIQEMTVETQVVPERLTLKDYAFTTPDFDLTATYAVSDSPAGDVFEYPAGFETAAQGEALRAIRMEQLLVAKTVLSARSDRMAIAAGRWFELEGASRADFDDKYLVTSARHRFVAHPEDGASDEPHYVNDFKCIPLSVPYRAPRGARRGLVRGVHSAVVTGPSGSEIHTDEHGRMKGKFFWDRESAFDDASSCWIRVAQLPIGGSMALARVGWEMGVAYLDGDPDRPVAVCRLYNAEKTSPYAYPAAATRMALKTPTSPGAAAANELRMEDGGGGMEMFVNASKDMAAETRNNRTDDVGADEVIEIGVDASRRVGTDEAVDIGANQKATIGADCGATIGADRTVTIGASETITVGDNLTAVVAGSDTETTGGSHTTLGALGVGRTCTGSCSLTVGGSLVTATGLGSAVAVAGAKSEAIGAAKVSLSGGAIHESVVGALASTVGGVCVQAAGANRTATAKGASALTVGGVAAATAGGKVMIKAKKISLTVGGVANFLGGGGVLNLTPASAAFVGMITLDASGEVKVTGNPNLIG